MTDVPIHLRVPAETKARWVRESREAGQKLTDWIAEKIDGPSRRVIDLRQEQPEAKRWYAVPYDDGLGLGLAIDIQPEWTNDYYIVVTEAWYPGPVETWKPSIAEQVLNYLERQA